MVSKQCSIKTTFKDGEEEPSKLIVVEKKDPEKVFFMPAVGNIQLVSIFCGNATKYFTGLSIHQPSTKSGIFISAYINYNNYNNGGV